MSDQPPAAGKEATLVTGMGFPVDGDQDAQTVGPRGPILLQDFAYIDKISHFDRERIPERVVHANGFACHGYFEVTHDITQFCKAAFLSEVGKRTPAFARFSTVAGERGASDADRDPRGFALKFYTEDGNCDLVCNNTPVFFIRDPMKFPDFVHSQKRNPKSNLKDPDTYWDFISLNPESCHEITINFSNRGTPRTFRHMHGFSIHALQLVNKDGVPFLAKMHFKSEQGIQNLNNAEAKLISGLDPDYAHRDFFDHLENGGEASWQLFWQIMTYEEAAAYKWDVLDATKTISHKDFPLIPVGRLVLNRNVDNFFAENEQVTFAPGHMVPGIEPSFDKLLQGRLFSYPDTHRHRVGANSRQLPINCPYAAKALEAHYQRDGPMCFGDNNKGAANYFPNSFGGPAPDPNVHPYLAHTAGYIGRHRPQHPNDDYEQAGILYRLMNPYEQQCLIENLADHMKDAKKFIQERMIAIFKRCDPEYGQRLEDALKAEEEKAKKAAAEPSGTLAVRTALLAAGLTDDAVEAVVENFKAVAADHSKLKINAAWQESGRADQQPAVEANTGKGKMLKIGLMQMGYEEDRPMLRRKGDLFDEEGGDAEGVTLEMQNNIESERRHVCVAASTAAEKTEEKQRKKEMGVDRMPRSGAEEPRKTEGPPTGSDTTAGGKCPFAHRSPSVDHVVAG